MNHEVEHNVYVEGARGEDAEAVGFEKHGRVEKRADGGYGGVETLEVAYLQDALGGSGEGDELAGFVEGGGDGFFDEDVDARVKELLGDFVVEVGGDADGCGVDGDGSGVAGGEELGDGGEDLFFGFPQGLKPRCLFG